MVVLRGKESGAGAIGGFGEASAIYLKSDLFVAARKRKREGCGKFENREWRQSVKVCSIDVERELVLEAFLDRHRHQPWHQVRAG